MFVNYYNKRKIEIKLNELEENEKKLNTEIGFLKDKIQFKTKLQNNFQNSFNQIENKIVSKFLNSQIQVENFIFYNIDNDIVNKKT